MAVSVLKDTELCWWWAQKYFSFFSWYLVDAHISETYCHGCILLFWFSCNEMVWPMVSLATELICWSPTLKSFSLQTRRNLIFGILAPKRKQSIEHILFSLVSADNFQGTKAQCWSKISPQWHRRQASVYWSHESYKKWPHSWMEKFITW